MRTQGLGPDPAFSVWCTPVRSALSLAAGRFVRVPGGQGSHVVGRPVGGGVVAVPRLGGVEGEGATRGRGRVVYLVHQTLRELVAIGHQVGASEPSAFPDERSGELEVCPGPDLCSL